jgi:hypothetical protein
MDRFSLCACLALAAGSVPVAADIPRPAKLAAVRADDTDPMFPDGLVHDFGILRRGVEARHAFRVVNTSNAPLQINSVRIS